MSHYLMFLPALLLLIGLMYPFLSGVYTSLTNQKLYQSATSFVGLGNYFDLATTDRVFKICVLNTLAYVAMVLAIQIPLGMVVALLLEVATPLRSLFRGALVTPLLVPPIVAGLMWKTMMHPAAGVINWLLGLVGVAALPWLSEPSTALVSVAVIDTWVYMPFVALILLGGLQAVPDELLEVARVDGASEWQVFRHIKLPWIVPYILLAMLFRVPDALKTFDIIYSTTRGGPINATRVLHVMAYEEAFRWSSTGRAMAIVMFLWLASYLTSTLLVRRWQAYSAEEGNG